MKNLFPFIALWAVCFVFAPFFAHAQCGTIATFAGVADTGRYAGDGGPATAARFKQPSSICRDRAGNVYILDYQNARIRKVLASTGTVVTIAGNGIRGYLGDNAAAISARIDGHNICCNDSGDVFLSDEVHRCVRKINHRTGIIKTMAGRAGGTSSPTYFYFSELGAICTDSSSNVFVVDPGYTSIYKIDTGNTVSLYCGTGAGYGSYSDGPASTVAVYALNIGADRLGNLYYTEQTRIRKVDTSGYVSTVAGRYGSSGYSGDGGPATAATVFVYTGGMFVDSVGNVYFSQSNGNDVRKIDAATGFMHSVAGNCCNQTSGSINSMVVTPSGSIIYADSFRYTHQLKVISREYTAIRELSGTDSLVSTPCSLPATYEFGVKGSIYGAPASGALVYYSVQYGDGASAYGTTTYWDTVIAGDTVHSFGSDSHWLPPHNYTYPGTYRPMVTITTLGGYHNNFYPQPLLVGSICDSNVGFYLDTVSDSIITAPCVYPATVRFTVHGYSYGPVNTDDSIYLKINLGNGTYAAYVLPLDTTGSPLPYGTNTFTAVVYHNFSSPGNFSTWPEYVMNSGRGWGSFYMPGVTQHFIHLDTCSLAGLANSTIKPYDSVTTICSLPYTDTFNIVGILHHASDTIPGIYYYVNYGDGSDDTVYAPMVTDGLGNYAVKAFTEHLYTIPGAFPATITPISPADAVAGTTTGTTITVGNGCGAISGTLYRDLNGNCMLDSTETPLAYWPIAVINNTFADTTFYWCDSVGHYVISIITGNSYTVMPDYFGAFGYGSDSLRVACPSTGVLTIDTVSSGSYTQDFAFRCFGAPTALDMGVYGWGFGFIPGDTGAVSIWASNPYGYLCDSLASTVTLTLDSNLAYEGMLDGPAPTSVSGNVCTWVFSTANDQLDFNANVRVSCLSTVGMGVSIQNTLNVSATSLTDPDTTNNTYTWQQPALSSWDPNEIEVSPKGFGTEGFILNGTPLSYMIHFQNTGTARARNITINDTINSNLDIATLQLVDASGHVMIIQPERSGGNVVKFRFANIFLPDSGADMEGSKGFVAFNIVPRPGLAAGTEITNRVGIYFDYNPAVITNTTLNTIEDTIGLVHGPDSVCVGASITLTNHIAGGRWLSRNGHTSVAGGIVTGVSTGIDTISYIAFENQVATKVVHVHTVPQPCVISGSSSVCEAASTGLSASVAGGFWTSAHSSYATVSSTGIVAGVTGGVTDTIFYNLSNTCGVGSTPKAMAINPLAPTGTIMAASPSVCAGATTTYSDAVSGGAWSTASVAIASVGTTGIVYGMAAGATYISYTTTNGCGPRSTFLSVTVNPLPVAGAISGASGVCIGATTTLSSSGTAGGSWASASTAIASVGHYGDVFGNTSGTTTITYTVNTATCGSAYTTAAITVNPIPYAGAITGAAAVCRGSSVTLTDVGGTTGGTWSSSASGTAAVATATGVVTGIAAGTATITYTANTASCGSAYTTFAFTVNALPAAGVIMGGTAACEASTLALANATGTAGGNWASSNTAIATISSTGVVTGIAPGTVAISYTAVTATCGNATTSVGFTINPLPVSGSIAGTTSLCPSTTTTLTDAAAGGTWVSTNVHTTHSGGVVTGVTPGIDTIGYSVTNSCGTSVARAVVTVYPSPATAPITGPSAVCAGASATLSDAVAGGSWSVSSALATISGSGIITGLSAGTLTTTYAVSNYCGTSFTTRSFTVAPIVTPAVTVSASPGTSVCVGDVVHLTANPVNGGTSPAYTWKNFGAYMGVGATYSYSPSNGDAITCEMVSNENCTSTAIAISPVSTMSVSGFETPTIHITASSDSVTSAGQVISFTASVTGGGAAPAFQWFINGGVIAGATNASYAQTLTSSQVVYCEMISNAPCVTTANAHSNAVAIYVGNLGIAHTENGSEALSIYPNPNTGSFEIEVPAHENEVTITIIDVNGKAVKAIVITDNKQLKIPVDMGNATPGVYMIKAQVGNTCYNRKVVVM